MARCVVHLGAVPACRTLDCCGETIVIDFSPFLEATRLLYEGPCVAERCVAVGVFMSLNPQAVHPVTHDVIAACARPRAVDTPGAGTIYTIQQVLGDIIALNNNLVYYANFMNLLDRPRRPAGAGGLATARRQPRHVPAGHPLAPRPG